RVLSCLPLKKKCTQQKPPGKKKNQPPREKKKIPNKNPPPPRPNRLWFFCASLQKHRWICAVIALRRVVKISSRGKQNPAALGIVSHRSKLNSFRSAAQFFARFARRIAAPGRSRCCN